MDFDAAFERLMKLEGGFHDGANDPGGKTKWGISQRSYPDEDIANLTLARAKEIYRRDYWEQSRALEMPSAIQFDVFDMFVNSSPRDTFRTLQRAVGAKEDGIIGPKTLAAVRTMHPLALKMAFNAQRLVFMTGLRNWPFFSRGWARRVASNLLEM